MLGETVVGTIGLALVTSLPELVVCLAAVRMGALDMAVGNLFGSNIFNVLLLPLAHFVRPAQSFWSSGLPVHALSLGAAMVLTCIIAAGIRRKAKRCVLHGVGRDTGGDHRRINTCRRGRTWNTVLIVLPTGPDVVE